MNCIKAAIRKSPDGLWKLKVLHRLYLRSDTRTRLDAKLFWNTQLQAFAEHGRIRVNVWQRDCDCTEGWHSYVCELKDLNKCMQSDLASAEGPMRHHLARPSTRRALPANRDRALEAFENGHPWTIHND